MNIIEKLLKIRLELGNVLNGQTEAKTKDGKVLLFDGTQIVEGSKINSVNDAGEIEEVSAGTFTLEDGSIVTVDGGVVISIQKDGADDIDTNEIEPVKPTDDPSDTKSEGDKSIGELTSLVAALRAELDELKATVEAMGKKNMDQEKVIEKLSKMPLAEAIDSRNAFAQVKITDEDIKTNKALRLFK